MNETIQTALIIAVLALVLAQRRPATKTTKSKKIVLDTCALIDGRIVPLTESGFVADELIVPDFVIHELQMLADGSDAHKRERARFGLDVVKVLQNNANATVTIDRSITSKEPTDDKLVMLAKKLGAPLYTTDYNLNKVADIESVRVMNVNELAQNLRPVAIPGERKQIKLLQRGSNPKQAVGYMEDGTMVVVDNATQHIGKTVSVEVTRTHQTVAGKMLFANLAEKEAAVPRPTLEQRPVVKERAQRRRPRAPQSKSNQY